jgi:hypothetical protein
MTMVMDMILTFRGPHLPIMITARLKTRENGDVITVQRVWILLHLWDTWDFRVWQLLVYSKISVACKL